MKLLIIDLLAILPSSVSFLFISSAHFSKGLFVLFLVNLAKFESKNNPSADTNAVK